MSLVNGATRRPAVAGVAPRRVLVSGERTFTSPWAMRGALEQAWGDGRGVLVTGSRPSGAERMAERLWRAWGGRVEAHPRGWGLHRHRPDHPARPTTGHAAGVDVHVSVGRHARVTAHEQAGAAVVRARLAVAHLTGQQDDTEADDDSQTTLTHDDEDQTADTVDQSQGTEDQP
ncbi:hypothetical protein ACTXG6_43510 [Pseudonocardia sp. Cha107L01]|uniref:hypothetical protein n=1 Tax=Pseudonocardia sp. Cha107L01 TaxID=3457576 RepID=UPI00403EE883